MRVIETKNKQGFEILNENFLFKYALERKPNPKAYKMHAHAECEIYYFMSGRGIFHVEGKDYPLQSGDILIMDNRESHYIEIDPDFPYERCAINFKKDLIRLIDKEGVLLEALENRQAGSRNLYRKQDFKNDRYLYYIESVILDVPDNEIQIATNLLSLLSEIRVAFRRGDNQSKHASDTRVSNIIKFIMENLDKPLSLDMICDKFYISKPQLCRIFKKSMGSSVWNYITLKRLLKAKSMIESGIQPTKVYTECGFFDYSSFYKAYKKHFGYAPAQNETSIDRKKEGNDEDYYIDA